MLIIHMYVRKYYQYELAEIITNDICLTSIVQFEVVLRSPPRRI